MKDMMTKEEYLRLIKEVYEQENDEKLEAEEHAWIPSEPPIKKRLFIEPKGDINATNIKKSEFSKLINKYNRITIGNFMIHIKSIVNPTKDKNIVEDAIEITGLTMYNIVIYEQKRVTPSGLSCNIQVKLNIAKDDRFQNIKWIKNFTQFGGSVTSEKLVDLIKWMQVITKLICFL